MTLNRAIAKLMVGIVTVFVVTGSVFAADTDLVSIDSGDTAWMLTSTALVLMMTIPGLALFYGGLVRSKNVLSTIMHSFFCVGLVSVLWVLIGYTLAFGPSESGVVGGLGFFGLKGLIGTQSNIAPTIPHLLFVAFQGTFAIITPALISGAFAERMRFAAFALFIFLWSIFIYAPLAHWVWGGGWIATHIGALDFAGGTVVHIASGTSALVTAIYLGKRVGLGRDPMQPHNLPLTAIGAALLWVGWFGFNAGSALGSNELAAIAFLNTNSAGAAAALSWLFAEYLKTGKPTVLGIASGAVAGLVAITPAAGFVTPAASLLIGLAAGMVCFTAVTFKPRIGYDDALDVVGIHMVGGTLGALATGIFATATVNPAVFDLSLGLSGGLLYGHPLLLWKQLIAILATVAYCGIGTWILLIIVNVFVRVRVDHSEEILGLDVSQHKERAYSLFEGEQLAIGSDARRTRTLPTLSGEPFTVTLEGVEQDTLVEHWRYLCMDYDVSVAPEFKDLYGSFTTLRNNQFHFRGGNQEQIRATLEGLFGSVSKSANARLAPRAHATSRPKPSKTETPS